MMSHEQQNGLYKRPDSQRTNHSNMLIYETLMLHTLGTIRTERKKYHSGHANNLPHAQEACKSIKNWETGEACIYQLALSDQTSPQHLTGQFCPPEAIAALPFYCTSNLISFIPDSLKRQTVIPFPFLSVLRESSFAWPKLYAVYVDN